MSNHSFCEVFVEMRCWKKLESNNVCFLKDKKCKIYKNKPKANQKYKLRFEVLVLFCDAC